MIISGFSEEVLKDLANPPEEKKEAPEGSQATGEGCGTTDEPDVAWHQRMPTVTRYKIEPYWWGPNPPGAPSDDKNFRYVLTIPRHLSKEQMVLILEVIGEFQKPSGGCFMSQMELTRIEGDE